MSRRLDRLFPDVIGLPWYRGTLAALVAVILMFWAGGLSAKADSCGISPSPIGFGGLQEKDVTIFVKQDTPCTVTFGRVLFSYFKQKVIKRPVGVYGVANTIYGAYRPPNGFIGDDYFEVLLDYQRLGVGQQMFRTILKITAKVAP